MRGIKDDAHWAVSPYQLSLPVLTIPSEGLTTGGISVTQCGTRSLKPFEEKIGQFPAGSKFVLPLWYRPSNRDEQKLEAEVRNNPVQARRDALILLLGVRFSGCEYGQFLLRLLLSRAFAETGNY